MLNNSTESPCTKQSQVCPNVWCLCCNSKLSSYRSKAEYDPDLYWPETEDLSVAGDLPLRGQRIMISHCMRQEIIHSIHKGHQSIVKPRDWDCEFVWWTWLSLHISQLVENCSTCWQCRTEHREALLTTPLPERQWLQVGTDLFQFISSCRGLFFTVCLNVANTATEFQRLLCLITGHSTVVLF